MEYEIKVEPITKQLDTNSLNDAKTYLTGSTLTTSDWDFTPTFYYSWPYTTTVYMYQLICPKCDKTNWGEIDKVIVCTGFLPPKNKPCAARLKAVSQTVDFEIPVK